MTTKHMTETPVQVFREFIADVAWWGKRLERLDGLPNGFEKWLATEWLFWIFDRKNLDRSQAGIEYKARLTREVSGRPHDQKQVDLWWSAPGNPKERWDFIELKVVFNNSNATKMFASAGWDLASLAQLDLGYESPRGAAVIVIGSGFHDTQWSAGVRRVSEESDRKQAAEEGGRLGALHWHSWSLDLT